MTVQVNTSVAREGRDAVALICNASNGSDMKQDDYMHQWIRNGEKTGEGLAQSMKWEVGKETLDRKYNGDYSCQVWMQKDPKGYENAVNSTNTAHLEVLCKYTTRERQYVYQVPFATYHFFGIFNGPTM